jgi:SAM-dependent methyltransferase
MAQPVKFTDHDANMKHQPLDSTRYGRPEAVILDFLNHAARGRHRGGVRVLDVGCGRGSRVAWLLERGWDAWGTDVEPSYLGAGERFFRERGWGTERLKLTNGKSLPFDAASFDVVLSDQVIEHVRDLDAFVAGISRVSRRDGYGLHVFPATWRPVEPHLRQPFVHWFPKGPLRHAAIVTAVKTGLGVRHFAALDVRERVRIYEAFSVDETFYRSRRAIAQAFQEHGMTPDLRQAAWAKTRYRLGSRLPAALITPAAIAYSLVLQTYVTTVKR